MTHTPAPWISDKHTVYALDEVGDVNRFSCIMQPGYVYHGRTVKEPISVDELTANARLISAAPELLEALAGIMNHHASNVLFHNKPMAEKAWAAIAKARGQ